MRTTLPWRKTLDVAFKGLESSPVWIKNLVLGPFPSLGLRNWPSSWRALGIIKDDAILRAMTSTREASPGLNLIHEPGGQRDQTQA